MPHIIYENEGGVSVIIPANPEATLEEMAAFVPEGVTAYVTSMTPDRATRATWTLATFTDATPL